MAQTTINNDMALGLVGEFYSDGGAKSEIVKQLSGSASVGTAMFYKSSDPTQVVAGTAGVFAGILAQPKNYALYDGLGASLELPSGINVALINGGYAIVNISTTSAVGDDVYSIDASGALGAGTATTGQTQISGAKVFIANASAGGQAVIVLNP